MCVKFWVPVNVHTKEGKLEMRGGGGGGGGPQKARIFKAKNEAQLEFPDG